MGTATYEIRLRRGSGVRERLLLPLPVLRSVALLLLPAQRPASGPLVPSLRELAGAPQTETERYLHCFLRHLTTAANLAKFHSFFLLFLPKPPSPDPPNLRPARIPSRGTSTPFKMLSRGSVRTAQVRCFANWLSSRQRRGSRSFFCWWQSSLRVSIVGQKQGQTTTTMIWTDSTKRLARMTLDRKPRTPRC